MATLVRRFLVLAALLFWTGGAIFYSAVVVPTGLHTIGLTQQVRVTRPVTKVMNVAGAVALLPLAWDARATRDPSRRRRAVRWLAWFLTAAALIALFVLHMVLDQYMEAGMPTRGDSFYLLHNLYLIAGALQVAGSLVYAAVTLAAWRAVDGGAVLAPEPASHHE
jgi:hypothetical protein